ncbi:MAG: hypothetical protein QOF83_2038 [Solirubrobacteraceae bacterium]|nr:hypothetical protein [Solirubrobacteraceae bacterium]
MARLTLWPGSCRRRASDRSAHPAGPAGRAHPAGPAGRPTPPDPPSVSTRPDPPSLATRPDPPSVPPRRTPRRCPPRRARRPCPPLRTRRPWPPRRILRPKVAYMSTLRRRSPGVPRPGGQESRRRHGWAPPDVPYPCPSHAHSPPPPWRPRRPRARPGPSMRVVSGKFVSSLGSGWAWLADGDDPSPTGGPTGSSPSIRHVQTPRDRQRICDSGTLGDLALVPVPLARTKRLLLHLSRGGAR